MEVILTGTGSPLPDANRAGPSTLVKAGDTHILVDAGRGVVMRMAGGGSLPGLLAGVLITHLHSDHICALNDVITTHWVMSQGRATLPIYGPIGTAEFVDRQLHSGARYRLPDGASRRTDQSTPGERHRVGTRQLVRPR